MHKILLLGVLISTLVLSACSSTVDNQSDLANETQVDKQTNVTTEQSVNEANKETKSASETDIDKSYKEGTIKLGSIHYPPYEYSENGQMAGPNIEIVYEAFQRLGIDVEIKEYPWSRVLDMVKTGELDGVIDVFDLYNRREYIIYPEEPIGLTQQRLMSLKSSEITYSGQVESLSNHTIGIVQDYSYGKSFDDSIDAGLVNVEFSQKSADNFTKLFEGRVDLIIDDIAYSMNYLAENGLTNDIKVLHPSISSTYSYLGLSKTKGLFTLREDIDSVLKEMKADGSFYDILNTHGMTYYAQAFESYQLTDPPTQRHFQKPGDGPITISLIDDTPPYVYKENGEYTGLIVDIVKEAFGRIGIEYTMDGIPFNRAINQLMEGTLDVGTDVFLKEERESFLHYPIEYPIAVYPYTIFKLKSTEFNFSGHPEDLIAYRIGFIRGYSLGDYDRYVNDDRFTFVESESPEANMKLLLNGRVDLAIDVQSTGEAVIDALRVNEDIDVVMPPINENTSYITFSKVRNLEKLTREYEAAIESMIQDGTLKLIYKKYDLEVPIRSIIE